MCLSHLKIILKVSVTALPLLVCAPLVFGAGLEYRVSFPENDLSFGKLQEYDIVRMRDCDYFHETGKPVIPLKAVQIAIPEGMRVVGVRILDVERGELSGTYEIFPAQPPRKIGESPFDETPFEVDKATYDSNKPYPSKLVDFVHQNDIAGQSIALIHIYPLRYIPATGKLILYTSVEFGIECLDGYTAGDYLSPNLSEQSRTMYERMVKDMVINPSDVRLVSREKPMKLQVPPGNYEHVIITSDSWVSNFQPLVDWHYKKGVRDTVITTSWIYANYSGPDDPSKIRAFVIDAHNEWGTIYFLMGGEHDFVPFKYRTYYDGTSTPSDQYYSDYDDDWACEVYVGRASVENTGQITTFIDKVLKYEKDPPLTNYPLDILLIGMNLDASTPCEALKETIDGYIPSRFDVTKVYDSHAGNHRTAVINALNDGQNLVNHADHADWNLLWTGSEHGWYIDNGDVNNLTNDYRTSIWVSTGCHAAEMDKWNADCIAEHFVIYNPNQAGVAFTGNTRNGYYTTGDPWSLTGKMDSEWWKSLFTYDWYRIGQTLANCKNRNPPSFPGIDIKRHVRWEFNLLGEPEMPTWTDTPLALDVTHPDSIEAGSSDPFTVTVYSGGSPVPSALACLWKKEDVFHTGVTNALGEYTFYPSPSTQGFLWVTVTKHNYLPYSDSVAVSGYAPPVANFGAEPTHGYAPLTVQFTDSSTGSIDSWFWDFGDGDTSRISNPIHVYYVPDTFDVTLIVSGPMGSDTLTKVNYILAEPSTIEDTMWVESASAVPGETGKVIKIWGIKTDSLSGYTLAMYFDPAVLKIDTITLEGTCAEDAVFFDWGDTLNYVTGVVVKTWFPPPPYIPPGEDLLFNLVVNILSNAPAGPTLLNLENDVGGVPESDNYFTAWNLDRIDPLLIDGILTIGESADFIRGDINGSGTLTLSDGIVCLRCQFVPGWSDSCKCDDAMDADDNGAVTMGDCLRVLRKLFVPGWQDSIPPPCCDYPLDCGEDLTLDDLGCSEHPCGAKQMPAPKQVLIGGELIPGEITVEDDKILLPVHLSTNQELSGFAYTVSHDPSVLSFVSLETGGLVTEPFDFVSALPAHGQVTVGAVVSFDFSRILSKGDYHVADLVFKVNQQLDSGLRLKFTDVELVDVNAKSLSATSSDAVVRELTPPIVFTMKQNYPNPVPAQGTLIRYQIPKPTHTTLTIYNLAGQVVKTLVNQVQAPGHYSVMWDGKNELGRKVSSGVYFYRLAADQFTSTRKLVVVE